MMDLYADHILDHYKHPRHTGGIAHATAAHEEMNVSCGDRVRIELAMDAKGIVTDIGWTGAGCAISQAGMSLLSERIVGTSVDELLLLKKSDAITLLGVSISERRLKCVLLGLHTLLNALRIHSGLPTQSWAETVANDPAA